MAISEAFESPGLDRFFRSLSRPTASLLLTDAPGASANLMIGASAVGGFDSQISFSCSAPAGLTSSLSRTTYLSRIQRVSLDLDHLCRHDLRRPRVTPYQALRLCYLVSAYSEPFSQRANGNRLRARGFYR